MASTTQPEKISSILPRIHGGQTISEPEKAKHIVGLMAAANQARLDYLTASHEVNALSQEEDALLTRLLDAVVRMHEAKVRVDAALKSIRHAAEVA